MKKWWARISCLLLAMLLVVTALPVFAEDENAQDVGVQSDGAQEDTIKDYVILLDCSMSGVWTDEDNLSQQAYLNFLDKMPLTGARLTIIAFGYQDGAYYDSYSQFNVQSQQDKELIHVLVNQQELANSNTRDQYKAMIVQIMEENRYNKQTWTPYAHALAAAVDLLKQNTDPEAKRNACIILISDGLLDDRADGENEIGLDSISEESERLLEEASKVAGEHDWPIYSIHLNYGSKTEAYIKETAAALLDGISANGGKNEVNRVSVGSADEVFVGLENIFADFENIDHLIYDLVLPDSINFEVEPLTSEFSISVFGEGITSVSLYRVDDNGNVIETYREKINANIEEQRLLVAKGEKYYNIKMIVPEEGKWQVFVDGTGGANVKVSTSPIYEMSLNMSTEAVIQEDPLTKNNTIEVDANFVYRDIVVDSNDIYTTMSATLKVYDSTGRKTILTIEPGDADYYDYCSSDKYGYHFQLPLGLDELAKEQAIKIQVVVENSMFRDGIKHSNISTVAFSDMATTVVDSAAARTMQEHVGGQFKLDLREIFNNPDGDPLTYELTCTNDPTAAFEVAVDNDQMVIQAGLIPGEYQMAISVKGENVVYDQLTLLVVNDPPRLIGDEIPGMELWSDHYWFQDIESISTTVDLSKYFGDYEDMPLSYTVSLSAAGVVDWSWESDGVIGLSVTEGVEGETEITVTVTDNITADSVVSDAFTVSVVSGKMAFWRDNWIYFAIAAAIILIIVIIIVLLLKNKRVKGEWRVTFDDTGDVESIEQIDLLFTEQGKKSKFLLKDLMNELALYLDGSGWDLKLANYFTIGDSDKIQLVGVISKKGCTVNKIPKNSNLVKVNSNGMDVAKNKVSFTSGTLTFIIEKDDGSGDRLTITMQML